MNVAAITPMGQLGRAALLFSRSHFRHPRVDGRPIMTALFPGVGGQVVFSSSTTLPESSTNIASRVISQDDQSNTSGLDNRVPMYRMRNNFAHHGPGLKVAINRNNLVAEFYDLTKAVIDGKVAVEKFTQSKTYQELEAQLDLHIDVMSNAQVVNILASLVKMRMNPSTSLVKLLEHEVKFRISSLTLKQVMKLIRFYNTVELSYSQKQVSDVLNNRIRACLNSNRSSVTDLVEVMKHLSSQKATSNLISSVEEKLLNALTQNSTRGDDIVEQFLPKSIEFNYESLCSIFIELAALRRRPTPLLKITSSSLTQLAFPQNEEDQPSVLTLISTLNALISLSYQNRQLVAKLMNDLTNQINLNDLDLATQCNLLRTMGGLKWRQIELLRAFYDYVTLHHGNREKVDHNLILSLIHITAQLNYRPGIDLRDLYERCMTNDREKLIDKFSRKWLSHVWSMAILGIANESHLKSVLNDEFIKSIELSLDPNRINHADMMKLLNLRAIAKLEQGINDLDSSLLDQLVDIKMKRSALMEKFASKIRDALKGVVNSGQELSPVVQTPYGFFVDSELVLDENYQPIPLDTSESLENVIRVSEAGQLDIEKDNRTTHVALIFVLFDETISNNPNEVVGHKKVIDRILKCIGYKTVFLSENLLSRVKTSADLTAKVREVIKSTASSNNPDQSK